MSIGSIENQVNCFEINFIRQTKDKNLSDLKNIIISFGKQIKIDNYFDKKTKLQTKLIDLQSAILKDKSLNVMKDIM